VFVEGFLRADDAGFTGLFSVHDEGIHEVDDDPRLQIGDRREAPDDTTLGKVVACYATTPEWAPGLPVAAEGVWADRYLK
jgi:hypothetical protein